MPKKSKNARRRRKRRPLTRGEFWALLITMFILAAMQFSLVVTSWLENFDHRRTLYAVLVVMILSLLAYRKYRSEEEDLPQRSFLIAFFFYGIQAILMYSSI